LRRPLSLWERVRVRAGGKRDFGISGFGGMKKLTTDDCIITQTVNAVSASTDSVYSLSQEEDGEMA
jgi:hypothetical protein